jgi:hypothetical protein
VSLSRGSTGFSRGKKKDGTPEKHPTLIKQKPNDMVTPQKTAPEKSAKKASALIYDESMMNAPT